MSFSLLLLGYRRIRANAQNAAALLNLCMEHSFSYADFSGEEDGSIAFSCDLFTAKRLLRVCQAGGVLVQADKAGGLPAAIWQRRERVGLLVGTALAIALFILSGKFVWDVRVVGNRSMSAAQVRQELLACGFGVGSYLPHLNTDALENRVLLQSEDLAWIAVRVEGTVAEVQVIERVARPAEESDAPANLVASVDGQIELVELFRGECMVSPGQAVRAGELLVSGIYDSEVEGFRYTRAAGRILARTEHTFQIVIPLEDTQKCYSGVEKRTVWLNFFQKNIKIFKSTGNEEGSCDIIEKVNRIGLFGKHSLPVSLRTEVRRFYEQVPIRRNHEEALELAYARLSQELCSLSSDTQLLQKEIATTLTEDALILDCRVLCIEDIAKISELEILP